MTSLRWHGTPWHGVGSRTIIHGIPMNAGVEEHFDTNPLTANNAQYRS
jgi:hypothetical protein